MNTTTFTAMTTWACDVRTTTLSCGCVEIDALKTSDSPRNDDDTPCDRCGKYHFCVRSEMEYHDCPVHASFFLKWPGIRRFYLSSDRDGAPQFGISAYEAYKLLSRESYGMKHEGKSAEWSVEQRWELVRLMASSPKVDEITDQNIFSTANKCTQLSDEMREELALSVKNPYWAQRFLKEFPGPGRFVDGTYLRRTLPDKAVQHLRWVAARRKTAFWLIRLIALALVTVAWIWHLPDWRTIVSLIATGTSVGVFVPMFREWFMERGAHKFR